MSQTETILLERSDDGVATITLNRPERKNSLLHEQFAQLREIFATLARDPELRCVVITGAGDDFSAGADLGGGGGDPKEHLIDFMRSVGDTVLALDQIQRPTIAKVRGVAAGASMNLAIGCDLVVAADTARFSEIFIRRGLSLDFGGSWFLPRQVGLRKAKEIAFFGDWVPAPEAERIGLVNRVVPTEELDDAVDEWVRRLLAAPPITLSMTKRLLNHGANSTLREALDAEGMAVGVNTKTRDTREALKAFLEKRDPVFEGH